MDALEQEGRLDEQFTKWMDEYGQNVHHLPLYQTPSKPAIRAAVYREPLDELDELYDQQVLMNQYSSVMDESGFPEVYR